MMKNELRISLYLYPVSHKMSLNCIDIVSLNPSELLVVIVCCWSFSTPHRVLCDFQGIEMKCYMGKCNYQKFTNCHI